MSFSGFQTSFLWARSFNGTYSHSVTIQVLNRDILADTVLARKWVGGGHHHSAVTEIAQIVSNAGVENFPIFLKENSSSTLFRRNVTSVTFHIQVFQAYALARWIIYFWEDAILATPPSSTPTQRYLVYDNRIGQVFHVHDFIGVDRESKLSAKEMEKQAIIFAGDQIEREHMSVTEVTNDLESTNTTYRVDVNTSKVIATSLDQDPLSLKESSSDNDLFNLEDLKRSLATWKIISIIALVIAIIGLIVGGLM